MEISEDLEAQRKELAWRLLILVVAVTGIVGHGKLNKFAQILDESPTTLGHILRGHYGMSYRILLKCKRIEGLTIDWLLTGDLTHLSPDMLHKLWRAEVALIVERGKKTPVDYHSVPQMEYDNLSQDNNLPQDKF
jgi:hypothetical protein